jgi:ABC-type bacteriocin/lantibiotic exporter with double-glycine peptidase domain
MKLEEEFTLDYDNCYTSIALEVENVSFQIQKKFLNNINLNIDQGERIFIDGANGSGKTTLIRILSGLIPNQGAISINDNSFKKINLNQFRSQIESIIYGETPFEGTVLENITFKNATVSEETLKWAIEGMQLKEFIKSTARSDTALFQKENSCHRLMLKKLLLARSISRPKILFYEDPTVDDKVANEIIDFITKEQWTIIVSSKNQYWKSKCNRNITLKNGQIILDLKITRC